MEHLFILAKNAWLKEGFIFIVSVVSVAFLIKKLIHISHIKHLFDEPSEARKIHKTKTPNLGGIAIAGTMILVGCLFINAVSLPALGSLFFSLLILLFTGVYDDLIGISALKKLMVQIVAAVIVVIAGYRFTSVYGFFGWHEVPYWVSFLTSVFFITFLINAFNLIDGINCLAGSIGLMVSACLAFYFWQMNDTVFALFAIALCGCLTGFLWFNKTPAKIFMGDSGAMFIGFLISVFSIHVLESNQFRLSAIPATQIVNIVVALLVLPVYDTVRVFTLRIVLSQSPFKADRNHIHHRLIDVGVTHMQATGLLMILNLVLMFMAFLMQLLRPEFFVFAAFATLTAFNGSLSLLHVRKQRAEVKRNKPREAEPEIRVIVNKKRIINV